MKLLNLLYCVVHVEAITWGVKVFFRVFHQFDVYLLCRLDIKNSINCHGQISIAW